MLVIKKEIKTLNELKPKPLIVDAWCIDDTKNLTGDVGTIEIDGDRERGLLIRGGFESGATYNATRDGQLQPVLSHTGAGYYFNAAIFAGWQRWMPTYRRGHITAKIGELVNVLLEKTKSQDLDLNINQKNLSGDAHVIGAKVIYMDCNPFDVGNFVVVQFPTQKWIEAWCVGFVSEPTACDTNDFIKFFDTDIIQETTVSLSYTAYTDIRLMRKKSAGTYIEISSAYHKWTNEISSASSALGFFTGVPIRQLAADYEQWTLSTVLIKENDILIDSDFEPEVLGYDLLSIKEFDSKKHITVIDCEMYYASELYELELQHVYRSDGSEFCRNTETPVPEKTELINYGMGVFSSGVLPLSTGISSQGYIFRKCSKTYFDNGTHIVFMRKIRIYSIDIGL